MIFNILKTTAKQDVCTYSMNFSLSVQLFTLTPVSHN